MLKNPARLLFLLITACVALWTFLVPDAQGFLHPAGARIFFWHLPCSVLLLAFMFTALYFSLRVFWRFDGKLKRVDSAYERALWDMRAESAWELGFVWSCLTMATGILFSLEQWGTAWQWDPRQSSFLIALLIYGAYFALRNSFTDPEQRASFSAAYALASALPIFFLVLVYPRLPLVLQKSFHPTDTIMGGKLVGQYLYVTLAMNVIMAILSVWLYRMRTRAMTIGIGLDFNNGTVEISGGDRAPTSVVRPVALPGKDGPTA